jgi:flavin reductase (DIM6/NTAB) family NADH-FMN oxidoreductase RutF
MEKAPETETKTRDVKDYWKIMAPRLTVLVTTMDSRGNSDVSPFSFVTPVSFDPPLLMIAVGLNKHSYNNILMKKEFVVNIPTEKLLEKVWIAGGSWDPEISKIDKAGLAVAKSKKVGPPSLTECVANIECYLEDVKKIGDHVAVIGKIIAIQVNEQFLDSEGRLKVDMVRPPLHVADNLFAFPYVTKSV